MGIAGVLRYLAATFAWCRGPILLSVPGSRGVRCLILGGLGHRGVGSV